MITPTDIATATFVVKNRLRPLSAETTLETCSNWMLAQFETKRSCLDSNVKLAPKQLPGTVAAGCCQIGANHGY